MNSLTEVMPIQAAVSGGTLSKRLFVIGYVTAIAIAMIGWLSAFGWIAARLVKWI